MNAQSQTLPDSDINDFYLPNVDQIEELRSILRSDTGHKFTYEETREIAYQLIRLYECLAQGDKIIPKEISGVRAQ